MKRPNKPLFIIDSSRSHGRGRETEWISCTSSATPFVAMATIIGEAEYRRYYDPNDNLTVYSDNHNGYRIKVEVTNIADGYDVTELRTLLRKALKEINLRHSYAIVGNATNEECLYLIDEMLKQNTENLREEPGSALHKAVRRILNRMHDDYSKPEPEQ